MMLAPYALVRYDQFSPLDNPEKAAYIVTEEEAQELAKIAKLGDLDIQFAKTEQGTAVLYNTDIAEKIAETREEYAKAVSELLYKKGAIFIWKNDSLKKTLFDLKA